jgi:hypothetical protein
MGDTLAVIVPTRGRPGRLVRMFEACAKLAEGEVVVLPCVDDDDPALGGYKRLGVPLIVGPRMTLSGWTNAVALDLISGNLGPCPPYMASLGDDHIPRTKGWDRRLIEAIQASGGPGIAYGDDGLQGQALPTAWVMSTEIVAVLGWMMLPSCEHMYVDNAIRDLGEAAQCLTYVPSVVIEHMHYLAGKALEDNGYQRVNAPAQYERDLAAYREWLGDGAAADAAKIKLARGGLATGGLVAPGACAWVGEIETTEGDQ